MTKAKVSLPLKTSDSWLRRVPVKHSPCYGDVSTLPKIIKTEGRHHRIF